MNIATTTALPVSRRPLLGEILVAAGKLQPRDLDRALLAQRETPQTVGSIARALGARHGVGCPAGVG